MGDNGALSASHHPLTLSGRGRLLSQAGTTKRRTVTFLDRAAAPQVMRGR